MLRKWPVTITLGLLIFSACSISYAWIYPRLNIQIAVYWFDVWYPVLRTWMACLVIPVAIIFLWAWMLFVRRGINVSLWIFPILIIANAMACIACLPGSAREYSPQAAVRYGNQVYYTLASHSTIGLGDVTRPYVEMYECDSLGFLCKIVYTYGGWRESISQYEANPWTSHLIPDPTTNTVALEIDGEIVYTHQP